MLSSTKSLYSRSDLNIIALTLPCMHGGFIGPQPGYRAGATTALWIGFIHACKAAPVTVASSVLSILLSALSSCQRCHLVSVVVTSCRLVSGAVLSALQPCRQVAMYHNSLEMARLWWINPLQTLAIGAVSVAWYLCLVTCQMSASIPLSPAHDPSIPFPCSLADIYYRHSPWP
jgi:hypothetical protein